MDFNRISRAILSSYVRYRVVACCGSEAPGAVEVLAFDPHAGFGNAGLTGNTRAAQMQRPLHSGTRLEYEDVGQ